MLSLAYAVAEFVDPPEASNAPLPKTKIPFRKGGELKLQFQLENFKPVYRDEYTGEMLPNSLVQKALCEELEYFNSIVWELVEASKAREAEEEFKLIRMRWVV